jgi:hypothetical protein
MTRVPVILCCFCLILLGGYLAFSNAVSNTEYSFLANVLAARGYLVVRIQHDFADRRSARD